MNQTVQAQFTWDGGGANNNWGTGANWVGDTAPTTSSVPGVTFAGTNRLTPWNDRPNWNWITGITFAADAGAFRLEGNPFMIVNSSGTNQINQNSAVTQEINSAFSFGNNLDSRINLNAGDLNLSAANLYMDSSSSTWRTLIVGATDSNDNTRRTLTIAGNLQKAFLNIDPDVRIQNNKRLLVTGTLSYGNGTDPALMVDNGVAQFSGSGGMTGGGVYLGINTGSASASLFLDTAGSSFGRNVVVTANTGGRRTVAGLNTTGTTTFSSAISGDGEYNLAAATGGTTAFSGTRNFNGGVHVNQADGATTYGGTVALSGTTTSTGFTALYNGTLQFSDFNQLGSGHFEFNATSGDSGTLRYTGGTANTTRTIWIDNSGITRAAIDVSTAGTTLTWNPGDGNISQNLTKVGAGTLVLGENRLTGLATLGVEAGKLTLTGANTLSGGTTVSGGTLEVSGGSGFGGSASALGTSSVAIGSGGAVRYWLSEGGTHTIANAFNLSGGTLHTVDGANTFSGPVTLASGNSTISARYEDVITFSGGLTGSGNVHFTQSGGTGFWAAPTYVLSAAGSNTGTVRVSGSSDGGVTKLRLGHVNALQSATLNLATGDAGVVEFAVAGANTYALGGLSGSRNLALGNNSLAVGGNNGSTDYAGTLSGSGGLTKTGAGQLRLQAAQTYTGTTAVNGGTLLVDSGVSLASTTTTVGTGAHLKVNGTVGAVQVTGTLSGSGSVGAMTLNSGGLLAVGNSPGLMTATSSTWNAGSTFEFEIADATGTAGSAWDLLSVSGVLDLAGVSASSKMNLTVLSSGLVLNYNPETQYSWVFARAASFTGTGGDWTSGLDVTDRFALAAAGFNGGTQPGRGFKVVTGTDGSFATLTLQSVPEPSSASLLVVGIGGLLALRRRRKS